MPRLPGIPRKSLSLARSTPSSTTHSDRHSSPPPFVPNRPTRLDEIMSTSVPAYRATSTSPSSSSRKAVKASATASASSSRAPTRSSDPFYGHEETAVLCARFITSLFQCPNIPTNIAPGAPTPTLAHFVAYALHRTRLPSIVTFASLLLLQRLKTRFPAARGSSGHRLFISAFMIASKVICDDTYSNQSWSIVAQRMFTLKEINQMEREMCGYLSWNLNVEGDEVEEFEAKIRAEHGPRAVARASSSSSSSSSTSDSPIHMPSPSNSYPTPDTTPDSQASSRPIRPVPSPYKNKSSYTTATVAAALPSPPSSPQQYLRASHSNLHSPAPHFASAYSSLASSPASDDCKTPSPIALANTNASRSAKALDMSRAYDGRQRQHSSNLTSSGYPINVGTW